MCPLDVGRGDSGTPPGVGLVVEEGLGNRGGELVWHGRVVGLEEPRLVWVEMVELGMGVGL